MKCVAAVRCAQTRIAAKLWHVSNDETDGSRHVTGTAISKLLAIRGTYWDHGTVHRRDYQQTYAERFTQPVWRRHAAKLFHAGDALLFRMPGYNKLIDLDDRWHGRRCDDDCGVAYKVPTDEKITTCTHMPLDIRVEIRCFEVGHKDRTIIERYTGERKERDMTC